MSISTKIKIFLWKCEKEKAKFGYQWKTTRLFPLFRFLDQFKSKKEFLDKLFGVSGDLNARDAGRRVGTDARLSFVDSYGSYKDLYESNGKPIKTMEDIDICKEGGIGLVSKNYIELVFSDFYYTWKMNRKVMEQEVDYVKIEKKGNVQVDVTYYADNSLQDIGSDETEVEDPDLRVDQIQEFYLNEPNKTPERIEDGSGKHFTKVSYDTCMDTPKLKRKMSKDMPEICALHSFDDSGRKGDILSYAMYRPYKSHPLYGNDTIYLDIWMKNPNKKYEKIKGLGPITYNAMLFKAFKEGYKRIILTVGFQSLVDPNSNTNKEKDTVNLYDSMGFRCVGECIEYFEKIKKGKKESTKGEWKLNDKKIIEENMKYLVMCLGIDEDLLLFNILPKYIEFISIHEIISKLSE